MKRIEQLINKIRAVERDDDLIDSDDEIQDAMKRTDDKPLEEVLIMTLVG